MTWEYLKAAIAAVIKTNGNQEITGALLQEVLIAMLDGVKENIPTDVALIKSTDSTAANDTTAYSSLKSDLRFLLSTRLNQPSGVAGLNTFGKIPESYLPSFVKSILEKQGSIQGVYNVEGSLYNGLIADIIGNVTIGVTEPVTDQFEIVLYNHDTVERYVTLGLNLWRDADDDLVVGVIRGSAQYETILLYPEQIYRAKAFYTGQGLAIEANIVGTPGPVDWSIIQNIPDATPYDKGVVMLGAAAGKAAEGDHIHDDRYSQTNHTHSDYAATNHTHSGVYAPASHSHTKAQISDFPTSWDWGSLANIPTATTSQAGIVQLGTTSTRAAAGNHTHSTYAATNHTHTKTQISDFSHQHAWGDITSVPAATNTVAGVVKTGAGTIGTDGIPIVAYGTHYHDDLYSPIAHTHSGYATAAQGTKADNALPASSYTAADVLAKLLTVDTDTSGINATTVKSITPGMGGLVLLSLANLGSGWTSKLGTAPPTTLAGWGITDAAASTHSHTFTSLTSKPTTRAGYGITDAAANVHYHQMSDISDFQAGKSPEYFASPISGSVSVNVATHSGVIARINGDTALNFSGTIYGDCEIMILNDSGTYRNLDLNFVNSVMNIKGSAPSTSITINPGELYRAKFHYIYAYGDRLIGVADVN